LLDVMLLASTIACVIAWRVLGKRLRLIALAILVALAVLQLAAEGLYWQFVPTWLVILVLAALALRRPGSNRSPAVVGAIVLMGSAAAPFAVLPVPVLPKPTGPYPVGSQTFRWVDARRPETRTADPADRRNVVAQAGYPAAPGEGQHPPYIDGLGRLPPVVSVIPRFILRRFDRVDTHAVVAAPVSTARARWPVVLFSPGAEAPRAYYTGLVTELASRGFIVLAVDHPYDSGVTELADGRIAHTVRDYAAAETAGLHYMDVQLDVRAADLGFVLDQLESLGRLGVDPDQIFAVGHSFGGAASAVLLDRDRRVKAAANIDGTLYGDVASHALQRPFLLLESDRGETGHGDRYIDGNRRLLENLAAPGYRFEISYANHYSFTDAPLFLSPPARFVVSRIIGGGRGPVATQRLTADILVDFLSGKPVAPRPGVSGGRVAAP